MNKGSKYYNYFTKNNVTKKQLSIQKINLKLGQYAN